MSNFRRVCVKLLLALTLFCVLPAASAFTIRKIEFSGLQRLTRSAMLSYLSVKVGQSFNSSESATMIRRLYKTGFFTRVNLSRRGNTLIVAVRERPTIGSIDIVGNSEIQTKQLQAALKSMSIQDGDIYSPGKLSQFSTGLEQQYKMMGYYAAKVRIKTQNAPRNRVLVTVNITEGDVAKIKQISFSGNKAFSGSTLAKTFSMAPSGLFSFFTSSDHYSAAKLATDLQSLTHFYNDHGYLQFKVSGKRVSVSADNQRVNIAIQVTEGPIYHVARVSFTGPSAQIVRSREMNTIASGSVFSRKDMVALSKKIQAYFANEGYAQAQVLTKTKLFPATKTVNVVFYVSKNSRIYVRRITFTGNDHSQDAVLRSRVRQMEGSLYSQKLIDESKQKIAQLPYFQFLGVQASPVPGKSDEVDLNFVVKERPAGQFMVQGGYSELQKFFYSIAFNQQNFMGSGKAAGISFTQSKYQKAYKLNWSNPMYKPSGISRSLSFNYTKTMPTKMGLGNYDMDDIGFMVNYGIPVSINNTLTFGAGYDYTRVDNFDPKKGSPAIAQYIKQYGTRYSQYKVNAEWTYQNLDQMPFPTAGLYSDFDLTMALPFGKVKTDPNKTNTIGYYTAQLDARYYLPLGKSGFIINPHLTLGYGNGIGKYDSLPFFMNFYGGGPTTLPGYTSSSLGPINPNDPDNKYMGGNVQVFTGLNFIVPNHLSDNLRTALFVAGGNIFDTHHVTGVKYEDVKLSNLRGSAGLLVAFNIPSLATLEFAIAKPFNTKPGDDTTTFGFTLGSAF